MTLKSGSQLGPYKIVAPLGAGGMGEVFEGLDTRLDRRVAIKVLPPHLSGDEQLRQRLDREAKAISALSHPNICTLFDVGREGEVDFIVLEYLEGESLAERLKRGPLSAEELIVCAVQIADALDKAHKAGIVHRDLKPGNVMMTKAGAKLLDFGLAKTDAPGSEAISDMTSSPTMSQPLTVEGTIMGTFQYMAPEQLEGTEADVRSDLFAFGATLHEMATGKAAFSGATQASLIGSILHENPPSVSGLAPMIPPALDRVIQVCLSKDPNERWQTAHDVLLQLRWIAEGGSVIGVPAPVSARRRSREKLAWIVCGVASLAALTLAVAWFPEPTVKSPTVRFQIPAPADLGQVGSPRLSPDGTMMAFTGTDIHGVTRIWKRPLNSLEAVPLSGTEGAGRPFWSPDSEDLAFFADGKLRRISASGGQVRTICDAPTGSDGSWGAGGDLLFDGQRDDPIYGVSASGGVARPVIEDPAAGDPFVGWPEFLPDGQHFLFMQENEQDEESWLMVGDLEGGSKQLIPVVSMIQFAEPDHLIYVSRDTLVAHRFDTESLDVIGDPIPLVEDVGTTGVGLAHFSTSATGILALRGGVNDRPRLMQLGPTGQELTRLSDQNRYFNPELSPSGRYLAASVLTEDTELGTDLWTLDLARGRWSQLTFEPGNQGGPVWSPNEKFLYHVSRVETEGAKVDVALYRRPVSGVGEAERLWGFEDQGAPHSISPDGRFLAMSLRRGDNWGIWILPIHEDGSVGEPYPFVDTPRAELRPTFSPDGKYIAYESLTTEGSTAFIASFPGPGGTWPVSTLGGEEPRWSKDGTEIYFLDRRAELHRAAIMFHEGKPIIGAAEPFGTTRFHPNQDRNRYSVTQDGETVVVLAGDTELPVTTMVLGWQSALEE